MLWMSLGGCFLFNNDDDAPPVMVEDTAETPTSESGVTGPTSLGETRLRVGAIFRYEAATGLPGPWLDESDGDSTSAIEFIVGDDLYDGTNGTFCVVNVPISSEGARLITELEDDQFWGVTLEIDDKAITTNCQEPQYQRIWDFYGGNLIEFITTNRDGSEPDWGIIVETPSANAINWLTGSGSSIEEAHVIGGEIRLSDRWSLSRVNAIAALAFETDDKGVVSMNKKGEGIPIPLEDVDQNPGIAEGVYDFIGYQYIVITNGSNP